MVCKIYLNNNIRLYQHNLIYPDSCVTLMIMILRFLFYAFLIYLAYKLLFELVIPLYRTTKKIKRGIREMQEKMEHHAAFRRC